MTSDIFIGRASQPAARYFGSADPDIECEVRKIAERMGVFTADDLHVLEAMIRELGRDRRIIGSTLTNLRNRGLIEELGYVRSRRQVCHGRPVLQWRWVG